MYARLPGPVDVAVASSAGHSFAGRLSVDDTPRFKPLVASVEGPIDAAFRFYRGTGGEYRFELEIRGDFFLTCQRCAEPIAWRVDRRVSFQAVSSEDLAARIDDTFEPCVVDAAGRVDLQRVAEDELILCLPLVARHDSACGSNEWLPERQRPKPGGTERRNPFEILKDLKHD